MMGSRPGAGAAATALVCNSFYTIRTLLCMTKGEARERQLRELCRQWHVPSPPRRPAAVPGERGFRLPPLPSLDL